MKKILLLFLVVIGIFPIQMFAWQGMSTPPLHIEGRYLKDPCGNNIMLHGWMQPTSSYFNGRFYNDPTTFTPEDCAEALNVYKSVVDLLSNPNPLFGYDHGWYNNFVRIWPPSNGWNNDGTVDEALQDRAWENMYIPYIEYCRQKGVYVVLVGNAPDDGTFMGAQHKSNMIAYWTRICNKYPEVKNADNVMFEICNEPIAIESQLGNDDWGSVTEAHDIAVQTYFQDIVNAIRGTGANNIIWVPGLIWQQRLQNFATYPISGTNIGYAGHRYPLGANEAQEIIDNFNSDFKLCSDKYPVIITEGSWHTMDSDQGLRTGTTEVFGVTMKNLYDNAGNISWICGMTEELIGNMEGGISAFTYPEINCGRAGFDWWPSYASNAPTDGCCEPTSITSYLQVDDGSWQQTSSVTVDAGAKVKFGPQPTSGGSWSWSGGGTSGTSREQTIYPTSSVTATATYTNTCGAQSSQNFTVNVNGGVSTTVHLTKRNASGFALDGGDGGANDRQIYLWSSDVNNANQSWVEIDRGNGYYSYQKLNTDYCIDGGNGGANGQAVILWPCDANNENQHWQKIDAGNSNYRLQKRNSPGYSIDGNNGGANEQGVYLWASDANNENQQWTFSSSSSLKSAIIASEEESISSTEKILAYPNPVIDVLNLQLSVSVNEIAIFSLEGKELYRQNSTSDNVEIDMSDYKSGIYFVKAIGQNESLTQKIMKQ